MFDRARIGYTSSICFILTALSSGCASTAGQWQLDAMPAEQRESASNGDFSSRLAEAQRRHEQAIDGEELGKVIALLQALLADQPDNANVQLELAQALILNGAAYTSRRADKRRQFTTAQAHAESVLLGNPDFRAAKASGQRPGLAASQLGAEDVPAMLIWATATAYLFDEGLTSLGRLGNFRGLEDLRLIMERAMVLDADHEYGLVPFSLAVFHIAAPAMLGGDLARAEELIELAIAKPGVSLLPRWGRARYLHALSGNIEAKRADLEWVLAQDPTAVDSPLRWNVYVQRDAQRLLREL